MTDLSDDETRACVATHVQFWWPYYWGDSLWLYAGAGWQRSLTRYQLSRGKGYRRNTCVWTKEHQSQLMSNWTWMMTWHPDFDELCTRLGFDPGERDLAREPDLHPYYHRAGFNQWYLYKDDEVWTVTLDRGYENLLTINCLTSARDEGYHRRNLDLAEATQMYLLATKGRFDDAKMLVLL